MSARPGLTLATLAVACLGLAVTASGQAAAGSHDGHAAGATDAATLPEPLPPGARLVTVGAALTDTVCELGALDRLLATDDGGHELPETRDLPSVGYARTLSSEGLLALRPDALLVGPEAGPPAVLDQIRATGVPVIVLPLEASEDGACARIRAIARLLGRDQRGEQLVARLQQDLATLRAALERRDGPPPRVMFLYARSSTALHVAGRGTPAEAMLTLAGASNALTGFDGYTVLTSEAAVSAAPDAIVVPARSLEVMGGRAALTAHPGLSLTPAVQAGRIIALDDLLLLGFGPRTGEAARLLAVQLDPQLVVAERRAGPEPGDDPTAR